MKSGIDNNGFLLLIIKFNKKIQSLQQSYIHDSKKKKCIVTSTEPPQINTSELQKSSEVIMLLKYTSLIMTILKLTKNLLLELLIHSKPNINHIKEEIIWINYFMVAQAQLINQCSPKNSQKNNLKKKEVNKKNDFVYIHILYCFSNQRICQVIHKYHPQQRQIYIIYHQKFQYNLYQSLKLIKEFINSQIKNFFYKTFIINFGLEYQSFDLNIEHQKKNNELQMIISQLIKSDFIIQQNFIYCKFKTQDLIIFQNINMYTPLKKINSFGFIDKNQDTISTASFIYTNQQHQDLFKYNNFDKQIYCEQSQNENDWLANQKQEVSEFGSQKQYINEKIEIGQFNEIKKTQTSQNKVAESMIKQTQQNDFYQKHQQSKSEISIKKQIQIDKCQNLPISSNKNQIRKRKKIFNKQTSKASNKLLVQTMQIKNEVNSIKKDAINNNLSINNHIKQNSLNLQKTDENNCFKLYKQLIKHQSNIMQWFQYLSNLSLDNVCKQQEVIKKILKIYIQLKNSLQNYKYLDYKQSLSILLNKCKLIQNSISLINFIKSNYEILQNKLKEFREFIKNFLVLNPLQKLIKYQSIALILSQLECIKIKYERKLQKQNLIAYTRYSQDFTSFLKTQTAQITELIILFNKQQLKQRFQQKKEVYLQQIKEKLLSNNLLQFEKFKILEYLNKINHQ